MKIGSGKESWLLYTARMELDCGIPERRIVAWLNDTLGLPSEQGQWVFKSRKAEGSAEVPQCRIATRQLENRPLGAVSLERTLVTITGDARATDEFYHLFTLQFISAGG